MSGNDTVSGHDTVGEPTTPRASATICVLREAADGLEVLMVRRSASARFMAEAWVFPGGAVDDADNNRAADVVNGDNDPEQAAWIMAALRELVEEAGIWLTSRPFAEQLAERDVYTVLDARRSAFAAKVVFFANWVTPSGLPIRFDARFFATVLGADLDPLPDMEEIDAAAWVRPAEALERAAAVEWMVPFPTLATLELLARAESAAAFVATVAAAPVEAVQPRIRPNEDGTLSIVLPGDPGFEDLDDLEPDAEVLAAAARRNRHFGERLADLE